MNFHTRPDRNEFQAIVRKTDVSQDPRDFYNLGCHYHYGWGVAPDFKKAAACYEKAIPAGIAAAENNLGLLYLCGQGVEQDTFRAPALFKKAADKGNPEAQHTLSSLFLLARYPEIRRNDEIGLSWLRKAAEAGFPSAMYNLGLAYVVGAHGLPKDINLALDWLKKAADGGHETAGKVFNDLRSA